jgi:hypothetical protein
VDLEEKRFVGYSKGYLVLERSKRAPGSESVQIFDVSSGREKMKILTSGKTIEVQGTKVQYWERRKNQNDSDCKGHEAAPGLGCAVIEKTEVDITSGKKRFLGEKEMVPIQ